MFLSATGILEAENGRKLKLLQSPSNFIHYTNLKNVNSFDLRTIYKHIKLPICLNIVTLKLSFAMGIHKVSILNVQNV